MIRSTKKLLIFSLLVTACLTVAIMALRNHNQSAYVYIDGKVTAYDTTPTATDGGIEFAINGKKVDIGGGLRAETEFGDVYSPISLGDVVTAKLKKTNDGRLTTAGCRECYVRRR